MTKQIVGSAIAGCALSALLALAVAGGCEGESCTKDTDCPMPRICVRSACVALPERTDGGEVTEDVPDVADEGTDDDAAPDADADADADGDGDDDDGAIEDVEDEGVIDGDGGATCTPVLAPQRPIITPSAPDAGERCLVIPSNFGASGRFVFFGRAYESMSSHALKAMRMQATGGPISSPLTTASGFLMGPIHPIVPLSGDGLAWALTSTAGADAGLYLKVADAAFTGGPAAQKVSGSDVNSIQPSLAFDGTALVMTWVQQPISGDTYTVRIARFSATDGSSVATGPDVGSGTTGTGNPQIVWAGTTGAIAYYNATDTSLHVVQVDESLNVTSDQTVALGGSTFVGYPAIAWNGSNWAVAWQSTDHVTSVLHLTTLAPADVVTDLQPITALAADEMGQVAITWSSTLAEWGVAMRWNQGASVNVGHVRIADDGTVIEGPVVINTTGTTAFHPSITFNPSGSSTDGYYAFSWIEQSGALFRGYESTRGCI